jgi:hypothetical protein
MQKELRSEEEKKNTSLTTQQRKWNFKIGIGD